MITREELESELDYDPISGEFNYREWKPGRITLHGKTVHLGSFATPNEAHEAYLITKRNLHIGCTI